MNRKSIGAFVRSFSWKDWLLVAVVLVTSLLEWGWLIGVPLGVVVSFLLVAALRIIQRAEATKAKPADKSDIR